MPVFALLVNQISAYSTVYNPETGNSLTSQFQFNSAWLLGILALGLLLAVILVPRYLDSLLNLGPMLALVGFAAASLFIPYATKQILNSSNPNTSARIEAVPFNLKIEPQSPTVIQISWQTPVPAISAIRYGTDPKVMEWSAFTLDPTTKKNRHLVKLINLEPGTTYYFALISNGKVYQSLESHQRLTFTTPAE